jgi:thiol-disulfide isomerase/thioredoxin
VKRIALYVLGGIAALLLGMWVANHNLLPGSAVAEFPEPFWAISLSDPAGHQHALSEWRGKTLVLNFWATWCPPCREEIPDFVALHAQYATRKVEFVGIALDSPEAVADYAKQLHMTYPTLIGDAGAHELAQQLGNPGGGLPFTIVVDPGGKIVLRHLGRLPRATLAATLAKNAS